MEDEGELYQNFVPKYRYLHWNVSILSVYLYHIDIEYHIDITSHRVHITKLAKYWAKHQVACGMTAV